MSEHYRGIAPVLALTRLVEVEDGVAEARTYLARQLKDRPSVRGEAALIDLTLAAGADPAATLADLKHITDQLLVRNRSEEHTSELQSLMRTSYAVFCWKKKNNTPHHSN